MSINAHVETERTFALPAGADLPPLQEWPQVTEVSEPVVFDLTARYFDTHDLRLARAKVTLRRRTGGHDDGWHLKLPATGDARIEHGAPLSDEIPAELVAVADPRLMTDELIPVCELRTRRQEWSIGSADADLALVVVDAVHSTNFIDHAFDTSWREAEVELVSAPAGYLDEVETHLAHAGIRPSQVTSKLRIALGDLLDRSTP